MPKVEDMQIGISPLTNYVYIGTVSKDGLGWKQKKDVTGQFIAVMLTKFPVGYHTITSNGKPIFEIEIKEIKES